MVRKATAIILSIWGWLCLSIAFYYTGLYFIERTNSSRGEYWEGVGYAWLLGVITWVALPVVTAFSWRKLNRKFIIIVNLPVSIAFIYFCFYLVAIIVNR